MNTNTPSKSDLYQAMPANNAFTMNTISQLAPLADGEEQNFDGTKKSIDERVFSDFSIDGSAKDFKQIKLEEVKLAAYEEKQKEKDDDFEGMLREQAIADMKEMIQMGGFEISKEELSEINNKFKNDVEGKSEAELQATAAKQGVSVEWLILRADMADDVEKNGWNEEDMSRKYGDDNVKKYHSDIDIMRTPTELENKIEKVEALTVNSQQIERINEIENRISQNPISLTNPSSDDFLLERPSSQIASTFTDEVNNVGANAKSFVLDETPQVVATAPDPFVLDVIG